MEVGGQVNVRTLIRCLIEQPMDAEVVTSTGVVGSLRLETTSGDVRLDVIAHEKVAAILGSGHQPRPVPGTELMPVTLCGECGEKIRRTRGGLDWDHFGVGTPYEPMTIGVCFARSVHPLPLHTFSHAKPSYT